MAFLGDAGKFVSCGKKRIEQLSDDGTLRVSVRFAAGEPHVDLQVYSARQPVAIADSGVVRNMMHIGENRYRVTVLPDKTGLAAVRFLTTPKLQGS